MSTHPPTGALALYGAWIRRAPASLMSRGFALLLLWQDRARERQRLRELSDHLLKDMGLTRADVERESSVPFWRP